MPPSEILTDKFDSLLDCLTPYLVLVSLVTGLGDYLRNIGMQALRCGRHALLPQVHAGQLFSKVAAIHTCAQQIRFKPMPLKGL